MLLHPYILGYPEQGKQNQKWLPHPCLLGAEKKAEMLRRPYILGDPKQTETKSAVATSPLPF